MLESATIAVVAAAYGLLNGAFLPAAVAYAILFLRKQGRQPKTFLRLAGRLLAAFVALGIVSAFLVSTMKMLGASGTMESDLETQAFLVGANIGFWGAILGLVIGSRRARKRAGATQAP